MARNFERLKMFSAKKQTGFTLIELMITVAIVAIVTSIALPSYQNYVLRTKRAVAAGCLLEMAQHMERTFTTSMSYAAATIPELSCKSEIANAYTFAFQTGFPTATTYAIDASPTGGQSSDTKCGTLSLNQAGQKSVDGTDTAANCWR